VAASSALLILSGIVCLGASALAMYAVAPREGKPPSFWTKTETRSTTVTLLLLVLVVFGIGLLAKGILG
jgi:hypothetical protein